MTQQERIEQAAESLINYNLVDLGDLVNQYDLRKMLIEMGVKVLQNQWISVYEELPPYEEDVFVINADGDCFSTYRSIDSVDADEQGFVNWHPTKIKYWMPIPTLEGGEK